MNSPDNSLIANFINNKPDIDNLEHSLVEPVEKYQSDKKDMNKFYIMGLAALFSICNSIAWYNAGKNAALEKQLAAQQSTRIPELHAGINDNAKEHYRSLRLKETFVHKPALKNDNSLIEYVKLQSILEKYRNQDAAEYRKRLEETRKNTLINKIVKEQEKIINYKNWRKQSLKKFTILYKNNTDSGLSCKYTLMLENCDGKTLYKSLRPKKTSSETYFNRSGYSYGNDVPSALFGSKVK